VWQLRAALTRNVVNKLPSKKIRSETSSKNQCATFLNLRKNFTDCHPIYLQLYQTWGLNVGITIAREDGTEVLFWRKVFPTGEYLLIDKKDIPAKRKTALFENPAPRNKRCLTQRRTTS